MKHYQNLLTAGKYRSEEDIIEFVTNIPHLVSSDDNDTLLSPISEEEISNIFWSMEPDKGPETDGFSIHFYIICWELIKLDLLRMVQGFMRKEKVRGGINSTFLTLIPKEASPGFFDRYRPISLCNSSYKIVAKLLENRIKPLLQKLISPTQGGFVKGDIFWIMLFKYKKLCTPATLENNKVCSLNWICVMPLTESIALSRTGFYHLLVSVKTSSI